MAGFFESLAKGDFKGAAGAAVENGKDLLPSTPPPPTIPDTEELKKKGAALINTDETIVVKGADQVREFQAAIGIEAPDGAAGPNTQKKMNAFAKEHGIASGVVNNRTQITVPRTLAVEADKVGAGLSFFDGNALEQGTDLGNKALETGKGMWDNVVGGAKGLVKGAQEYDCTSRGGTFDPGTSVCTGARQRETRTPDGGRD